MDPKKRNKKLSKFIGYVLGRRPDEFGLVPDQEGYVKIKTVLKALNEEEGWRHIRRPHLKEALITLPNPAFEMDEHRIRAKDRDRMPPRQPASDPPKLLFTCIRRRAYPHVSEKGIEGREDGHTILSSDQEMALRIGKRSDASPVLLTINTEKAEQRGVAFDQCGDDLYLAPHIPTGCFTGPPLPKEPPEPKKPDKKEVPEAPKTPGSFFIDPELPAEKKKRTQRERRKKEISWKKERKRGRTGKW